jgi:catecholate siderophore receptor
MGGGVGTGLQQSATARNETASENHSQLRRCPVAENSELPFASSPSLRMLAGTAFGLAMAQGGISTAMAQSATDSSTGTAASTGTATSTGTSLGAATGTRTLPTLPVQGTNQGGGYQVTLPALDKLTAPLVDTPQSVVEVPKQLLDDEGVTTMRDALRNVPGVSLAAGEGGQQGDNLSIRGFNAQNDFYLDGMRDFGSYYRDPFNLQDIEILEGPSSILFGRGSSGGAINQVSKQPVLAPITTGSFSLGTDQLYRITADVNRAIPGLVGGAFRMNVMANTNGIAGRDNAANRRFGFAPEIALGLGTDTRFTLDFFHLQSYDTPDYGIPWLNGRPAQVAHSNFYGFADNDFFRTNVNIATAKLEHDFSDVFTVTNQFRYGDYRRDLRVTEPQILSQGIANNFSMKPLSNITVSRNLISLSSEETTIDDQVYGSYKSNWGFVKNALIGGFEIDRQTSNPTRYAWPSTTTSLLYPNSAAPFNISSSIRSVTTAVVNNLAPYAVDTVSLGKYVDLMGGWRWDVYDSRFTQTNPSYLRLTRNDELPSWRGAVIFKPTSNGSIYFDYGTSFDPSAESLSLSAATAVVAPEKETTYEVGTKWDVLNRKLSLTGALYQIRLDNARETDPNNPTLDILAGVYRVRGFQLTATGHLTDRWEVFGGYSYNDGVVISSVNANELGHAIPNAPKHTVSFFTSYHLPMPMGLHDLEVGGGVNFVSTRTASSTPVSGTNTIETAPGYVTAQVMAKYPINDKLNVQLNVTNISDTYYYDSLHPGHIILGAQRAAMITLNAKL